MTDRTNTQALTRLARAVVEREPRCTLVEYDGVALKQEQDWYQVAIEYPVGSKTYCGVAFLPLVGSLEQHTQALEDLVHAAQAQMLIGDPFGAADTLAGVST